jgi:hypothetical protein
MLDIIVHDKRLEGVSPKSTGSRVVLDIDQNTSLDSVLTLLAFFSKNNPGYKKIMIMAHGYEDAKTSRGGLGMQLGKEDLGVHNVQKWNVLKGKVKEIILYSCAVAGVQVGKSNKATEGNGIYFCTQLAFYSGATVTASMNTQYYDNGVGIIWDSEIDFGDWEGVVLTFYPDGKVMMPNGSKISPYWETETMVRTRSAGR